MGWLEKLRMRLRALRHGEEVHGEIAEEWQFHIDLRTEENIRRGMTPEEARQSAEQHFGNAGYIKDVSWDVRAEESWKLSGRTCDAELGSCGEALDSHLWRCSRWDWGLEATRLSSV